MTTIEKVELFMRAMGQPVNSRPYIHDTSLNALRLDLIEEEYRELEEALGYGTEEEVLDALIDLQYVLDGAFLALGFHKVKDLAFNAVHEANMRKLGSDGKPILRADGKALKPEGWTPANLSLILRTL